MATEKGTRVVDLRSDTVTKPTQEMLAAMMSAELGDDVFGDDPTVNELQAFAANMFGMEAGLFCPSGTMTNQIAIKLHTQPGDELICADTAHIYCYEGGGIAFNSGVQPKLLPGDRGRINAAAVAASLNPDDVHFPRTALVCLENTTNKGGGAVYALEQMRAISELCRSHGIRIHLDGARVFNACVAAGYTPADIGPLFDTVSICLSKGLGCPIGSLLLGSSTQIAQARRIRKILGGGMRQAGILAAAGLYALKNHVDRLVEDHRLAEMMGNILKASPLVQRVLDFETNIVIFELNTEVKPDAFVAALKSRGVLSIMMSATLVRVVTHLWIKEADVLVFANAMAQIAQEFASANQ